MKQHSSWYRADIDGLRGIAILAVIALHFSLELKMSFLKGGALGVDIFFVISGYLITTILLRELEDKTFSLVKFWERRIRRIVPALVIFLLCISTYIYLQDTKFTNYHNVGPVITAQSFFILNHYLLETNEDFFMVEGVRATDTTKAQQEPLNHLWSLSIEEQFYILFPLILFLVVKLKKEFLLPILLAIATASFFLYFYLWYVDPFDKFFFSHSDVPNIRAGFYILPSRAWELLAGVLAAFVTLKIKKPKAEIISASGISLIVLCLIYPTDSFALYLTAPLCVLGTVLVILANKDADTYTKRFLSIKPLVWLGLISYSLYLWHRPLYIFLKDIYSELPYNFSALMGLLAASIAISTLSYHYVEKPFLQKNTWSTKEIYLHGFLALTLTGLLGLTITLTN